MGTVCKRKKPVCPTKIIKKNKRSTSSARGLNGGRAVYTPLYRPRSKVSKSISTTAGRSSGDDTKVQQQQQKENPAATHDPSAGAMDCGRRDDVTIFENSRTAREPQPGLYFVVHWKKIILINFSGLFTCA